jgi:hypothetical protein
MLNFNEVNLLGAIIDTTFGRSSTDNASLSVKAQLSGETLVITYHEIVNIARDQDRKMQFMPCEERGNKAVKMRIAEIEKEFKKAAKRDLKAQKMCDPVCSLSPMSFNTMNPVAPNHFRCIATYKIG